jgi:hypothetical protein
MKRHLEELEVFERRNLDGEGGWYVSHVEAVITLCGPFSSERDAQRSAVAIERWLHERERLLHAEEGAR